MNNLKLPHDLYNVETPAFVYNSEIIKENVSIFYESLMPEGGKLLFSVKSFAFIDALKPLSRIVDGFSVSSLFEAKLVDSLYDHKAIIHFTSPGLKKKEYREISQLCNLISFNSFSQWERMKNFTQRPCKFGLRLNPNLSFIDDIRYDPCCPHSKLGIPLRQLSKFFSKIDFSEITGLHFHSNCDSYNWLNLVETLDHLKKSIPQYLWKIKWLNIGGGYLINSFDNLRKIKTYLTAFSQKLELIILLEPGSGLINNTSFIVSEVIDAFESDSKKLLILDTTVNHIPEVFEYNMRAKIYEEDNNGKYEYSVYGCSCLSGDYFGDYSFSQPISVGTKIIFSDVGSYSLVKANMFNGINLPNIYEIDKNREINLKKIFTFGEFYERNGGKRF
jgi:carboxynorspermidine decarboxylase